MLTRFRDDDARVINQLEQSTGPGRYMLNVPGNGSVPDYMADPHVRLQKWGANIRSNPVDTESYLMGRFDKNKQPTVPSGKLVHAPTNTTMYTEQPRSVNPAFLVRDIQTREFPFLLRDPQAFLQTDLPMHNIDTRKQAKDAYYHSMQNKSFR